VKKVLKREFKYGLAILERMIVIALLIKLLTLL